MEEKEKVLWERLRQVESELVEGGLAVEEQEYLCQRALCLTNQLTELYISRGQKVSVTS